jgi:Uma2 family endonuclease
LLLSRGGQTRDEWDYIASSPEWLGEIGSSTESYDLYEKKGDYEKAGVKEYVVVALRQNQVFWFVLREGKYQPLLPGPDGTYRSEVFPGLWLDPAALLRHDIPRMMEVLRQGLASSEHAEFLARLSNR